MIRLFLIIGIFLTCTANAQRYIKVVGNKNDLRALNVADPAGTNVFVNGSLTSGDGGQGIWSWFANDATATNAYILSSTSGGVGRWKSQMIYLGVPVSVFNGGTGLTNNAVRSATTTTNLLTVDGTNYARVIVGGLDGGTFKIVNDDGSTVDNGTTYRLNQTNFLAKRIYDGFLDVTWFGAIGNNVNDDYSAIQRTINAAALLTNGMVYIPSGGFYKVGTPLLVPAQVSFIQDSPINYTGNTNTIAITTGSVGFDNVDVELKIWVYNATQSDWSSESSIGARIMNSFANEIEIVLCQGFTIGAQFYAESGIGFVHNFVRLGRLINNKIGVDLANVTGGYVNENQFFNGSFSCYDAVNTGQARYGVRSTSLDATYLFNNNNIFQKPSFELNQPFATPQSAIPIFINYGSNNKFWNVRDEGNGTYTLITTNQSSRNSVTVGDAAGSSGVLLYDGSIYPANTLEFQSFVTMNFSKLIFDSKNLYTNACLYNGTTEWNFPNVHIAGGSSGLPNVFRGSDLIVTNQYVQATTDRALGVFVDTTNNKRFVVSKDTITSFGGRVSVRCYDASGTVLTSGGAGHPYVKGNTFDVFTWNGAIYNGVYVTGSDNTDDDYFEVGDAVKTIAVLLHGGDSDLRIKSFSIYCVDYLRNQRKQPSVWPGYTEIIPGANLGTTFPTLGDWLIGKTIYSVAPTADIQGWLCTASGTPGTWRSFGATPGAAATVGSVINSGASAIFQFPVYYDTTGTNVTPKSFVAGSNITLTTNSTGLTIATTSEFTGTSGTMIHSGSSAVFQIPVSADTTGTNWVSRDILAGGNIAVTTNSSGFTVAVSPAGLGPTSAIVNSGASAIFQVPVYYDTTGTNVTPKSILAGSNITITTNSTGFTIDASGGGGIANSVVNSAASAIFQVPVYYDTTGTNVTPKSILGGSNVTITTNSTGFTIDSILGSGPTNTLVGNLTTGVVPYASGPTNLADSPMSRLSSTNVLMPKKIQFGSGATDLAFVGNTGNYLELRKTDDSYNAYLAAGGIITSGPNAPQDTQYSILSDSLLTLVTAIGSTTIMPSAFSANDSGFQFQLPVTITTPGTTGNQTINKMTGRVNIAAGGSSITVNNNLVTTNSLVFPSIATDDSTAIVKNCVATNGSFVIKTTAAVTAETAINFMVINNQ